MEMSNIYSFEGIVDEKLTLARDYSSILEWSVDKAQTMSPIQWSDYKITDPGVIMLSMISYLYDHVNYELDSIFLNNLIRYSNDYNILKLMANFMGIETPMADSSLIEVEVSTKDSSNGIVIPKGYSFVVYDSGLGKNVYYNTLSAVDSSSNKVVVQCVEGEQNVLTVNVSAVDDLNRYFIDDTNIAGNIFQVTSVSGSDSLNSSEWVKTDNALLAVKDVYQFSVHSYVNDRISVRFFPGFLGELSAVGQDTLILTFFSSNGKAGRLSVDTPLKLTGAIVRGSEDISKLLDLSIVSSYGGRDKLTIDELRVLIGSRGNALDTYVNNFDYTRIADMDSRVYKSTAKPVDVAGGKSISIVYLTDQEYASEVIDNINERVDAHLEGRIPLFTSVSEKGYTLSTATFVNVNPLNKIEIDIYFKNNEVNTQAITDLVEDYIDETYRRDKINFGMSLRLYDLRVAIENLHVSISHVIVRNPLQDVVVEWNQVLNKPIIAINYKFVKVDVGSGL